MSAVDEPVSARSRQDDVNADLGFGSVVARESRKRLLNRDGSFNVAAKASASGRRSPRITTS